MRVNKPIHPKPTAKPNTNSNRSYKIEKAHQENITMLPSVKLKAIRLSIKYLGTVNFSGVITFLINKEDE